MKNIYFSFRCVNKSFVLCSCEYISVVSINIAYVQCSVMSSACIQNVNLFETLEKSLYNNGIKSNGQRIEPLGTPLDIDKVLEKVPLNIFKYTNPDRTYVKPRHSILRELLRMHEIIIFKFYF